MEDRRLPPKPAVSSPSQSTTPDPKTASSRPLYSSKLGDQKGRSESNNSPNPAGRQPPAQQKAWTSNKNPITGRSQTPQGGFNSNNRQFVTGALHEGQKVRIALANGAEFEGIYANNPTDPSSCYLRMVQQRKVPNTGDIANGTGRGGSNMSFQRKDIVDARVLPGNQGKNDSKSLNGGRSFRTDAAISNSRAGAERPLKPWVPDSNDEVDGSLENASGGHGRWDQFAENERLFGLTTDYDENIYTTTIDKSHPQYQQRIAAAERKAREIERSAPTTAHVAEERIMDFVGGGGDHQDEEDKYSGVRRQDFPPLSNRENKYMPPARRGMASQNIAKAAPVDPAIISSQLKKQPTPKLEESKAAPAAVKAPATEIKSGEAKPEARAEGKQVASKAGEGKAAQATPLSDTKSSTDKSAASLRSSADTSRGGSRQAKDSTPTSTAPNATSTVERDVLKEFKTFASREREQAEKARHNKAKADKEVKLIELKKFADSFKLSTPVPNDLISIIAKDPVKQKQIQAKALQDAENVAKQKAVEAASAKEKGAATSKDAHNHGNAKAPAEPASATNTPTTTDSRTTSRPNAPQHSSSSGLPNRHPGNRQSYNNQAHYQQGYRNRAPPHLGPPNQPTGNLAQRIREQQQKMHQHQQHPHMNHHVPVDPMRLPPTGPSNSADSPYGRRLSGVPLPHMAQAAKLNPNSHEFRPNAFAPAFNPAGPSQGSSPRSSVNNVMEAQAVPTPPAGGQLIRRKTKAIDVTKCFILSHIKSIPPPQGRNYDDNEGLRPSYDTLPTWRQLQEETERPDSTMHLTYKEYFEKLPLSGAAMATPNPPHVVPQLAHQHQLPLHLQHSAHNPAIRQSPHMPPMQMHSAQHGHAPHVPFSNPDDHRMMHSASAQSFASPRMGHVPMAYPPAMNSPAPVPYNQPQPYMNPGTPQMPQYRSFSNTPQFMPQQSPHMGGPIMMQPQFIAGPNGMVAAGHQVPMYPVSHPQFVPHGAAPPQPMAGSNGFPSPGRPAAPMMAHQGSHQGQPMYGMSPGMQYQQPVFAPQQPQQKFSGQRPQ